MSQASVALSKEQSDSTAPCPARIGDRMPVIALIASLWIPAALAVELKLPFYGSDIP